MGPPLLLNLLNVLYTDGTAAPGAEGARLLPGRAFPRDDQRLRRGDSGRLKQEIMRTRFAVHLCRRRLFWLVGIHIASMINSE